MNPNRSRPGKYGKIILCAAFGFALSAYPAGPIQAPGCNLKKAGNSNRSGLYQESLASLKACADDAPTSREKGAAYHGLYQPDSAIFFLKKAFDGNLRDDAVLTQLAEAFLWKKDFRSSMSVMEGVKNKKSPAYLKVSARKHEILGEFDAAVKLYDQAIALEKLPYGTMERKAVILSWMKKYDEAIAQFDAIIGEKIVSKPLKVRCMIRRAEVRSWKKEFDPALAELDKALAMDAKNVDARLVKGKILEWKGAYKPALAVYKEILVIEPANDQAKLRMEKISWVE